MERVAALCQFRRVMGVGGMFVLGRHFTRFKHEKDGFPALKLAICAGGEIIIRNM